MHCNSLYLQLHDNSTSQIKLATARCCRQSTQGLLSYDTLQKTGFQVTALMNDRKVPCGNCALALKLNVEIQLQTWTLSWAQTLPDYLS